MSASSVGWSTREAAVKVVVPKPLDFSFFRESTRNSAPVPAEEMSNWTSNLA